MSVKQLLEYAGRSASLSECQRYRYSLHRIWDVSKPVIGWIGLNPSKANAEIDDPTIRRMVGFTDREGGGGLCVVNLFALRSTDPAALSRAEDPIGPDNDAVIIGLATGVSKVIACWGNLGAMYDRDRDVMKLLADRQVPLWCLGISNAGRPKHPLYLANNTELVRYTEICEHKWEKQLIKDYDLVPGLIVQVSEYDEKQGKCDEAQVVHSNSGDTV